MHLVTFGLPEPLSFHLVLSKSSSQGSLQALFLVLENEVYPDSHMWPGVGSQMLLLHKYKEGIFFLL